MVSLLLEGDNVLVLEDCVVFSSPVIPALVIGVVCLIDPKEKVILNKVFNLTQCGVSTFISTKYFNG